VLLRKVATTPHERMTARTMRADFGPGFDDDALPARPGPVVSAELAGAV
jgi:hypothetical protein